MRRALTIARLLSLVIWVGGLIFFAFVLAPTAFGVLRSKHDAGLIVGASLRKLDWIGLGAGAVSLAALLFDSVPRRRLQALLLALMLGVTAGVHWGVLPRMEADRRVAGGDFADSDRSPARADFDRLHRLSEQMAGTVLFLGIVVTVLMSAERDCGLPLPKKHGFTAQ